MKNNIIKFCLGTIFTLSMVCSEINIPTDSQKDWEILQNDKIWIGWIHYDKFDWCQAVSIIHAPIEDVREMIEDKKSYPQVFKRIERAEIITDEIVYIALDMPFPFSGRDYVVKYIQEKVGSDYIYQFHAVINSKAPMNDDYVRLINAAGEWKLNSLDINTTEVSYTWNGELLGDFPDWGLTRAWKQQGLEVFNWLQEALEE